MSFHASLRKKIKLGYQEQYKVVSLTPQNFYQAKTILNHLKH